MCDCNIDLSLRNIIDMGLKPAIQNITTIVAAVVANSDLFGNYEIDFVFILGSTFTLRHNSPLQVVYAQILQEELAASIELNGKDTPGYILRETLCELLQPKVHGKPYMYDSFCFGNINQISSEIYAVYIDDFYENPSSGKVSKPFLSCKSYNIDGANVVKDADAAMIVLQKGQPIPNTGLVIQFNMGFGSSAYKELESNYVLKLGNNKLVFSNKILN